MQTVHSAHTQGGMLIWSMLIQTSYADSATPYTRCQQAHSTPMGSLLFILSPIPLARPFSRHIERTCLPTPTGPSFTPRFHHLNKRPTGAAWLFKVLLQALGDPDWDKREAASSKERRVKYLLKRETELVVIADIHHLINSGEQFELLVSIFQV